ncbi:glycerol-3-phosphate O-acyltransferase 2, variant 2 [Homalodisca vitripennis]|nr:glycerol-3-phosphate O-acyltransferase 2, variant 2 [Homalodisca vitripennis]
MCACYFVMKVCFKLPFSNNLQKQFPSLLSYPAAFKVSSKQFSLQTPSHLKSLSYDNINPGMKATKHDTSYPMVYRAAALEKELREGAKKPFTEIIKANVNDAQAVGQSPITFVRQVLSLVVLPELSNDSRFPEDVKKRAKEILDGCKSGSVGAYSESTGIEVICKQVAKYLELRDGVPSNWANIILTMGSSEGVQYLLSAMNEKVEEKKPGIMIPIPEHPLYSACISEFGMEQVGYYLKEEKSWSPETEELERAYREAAKICRPRAIVVINPGNPTGQVLTEENIMNVIQFAHKHNLFILADEVYQDNIYEGSKFYSFKKTIAQMGSPFSEVELASFMSCSKGYMNESGLRGGYVEVVNTDPQVISMLVKSFSARLCSGTDGQAALYCMANPPQPGEPSYEQFKSEKEGIFKSMAARAKMVSDGLNGIPGISCNAVQGAMCAFPQDHNSIRLRQVEIYIEKNKGIPFEILGGV